MDDDHKPNDLSEHTMDELLAHVQANRVGGGIPDRPLTEAAKEASRARGIKDGTHNPADDTAPYEMSVDQLLERQRKRGAA
jgi:hypothetical protein